MERIQWICVFFVASGIFHSIGAGSFTNHPGTIKVHENEDNVVTVWNVEATCTIYHTISKTCYYDCSYTVCNRHRWGWCSSYTYIQQTCSYSCTEDIYSNVDCDTCSLTNTANIFQMSGSKRIQKVECTDKGCGPTCSAYGCLTHSQSYTGTVKCWRNSYPSLIRDGEISTTFTMQTTQNVAPTFNWQGGSSINVYHDTTYPNNVVNTMVASDSDAYIDGDSITYTEVTSPRLSWIHKNQLFQLTSGGQVKIIHDLTYEFSYTFEMVVTVHDRRHDTTTGTLSISLHACFQTPNCTDKSDDFWDTHGLYTGHGSTNTMFTMTAAAPTYHFPNFNNGWHQLQWTYSWNVNIHPNLTLGYYSGVIYATGNMSIFPAYPSKSFSMTITVGNSESCYRTTCQVDFTIYFTNWDIHILNGGLTYYINEDNDDALLVHTFDVYDYNYWWEDNVTCAIDSISNAETNMFEIKNVDNGLGTYAQSSFELWRMECLYPLCGYKYDASGAFTCPTDSGCFTHNITQAYIIYVTCSDAYGSSDSSYIQVSLIKNEAPVYSNLPITLTFDTDVLAHHDVLLSILYSDNEYEDLIYEYSYGPTDYGWFIGDSTGNYYDNLGNISMTTYLWNATANTTHWAYICGHERRNEICNTFTINMRSNCGTVPTCADQTKVVDMDFSIGDTLFDVSVTTSHTSCTYSITSDRSGYFTVDQNTGQVTTLKALAADGTNTATYTIVNFIYHSGSCSYGSCSYTVYVDPVNYPIYITNLDATAEVAEDTTAKQELYAIVTSDANSGDEVSCDVTDISPDVGFPPLFYEQETYPGSQDYVIWSRESPGFNSTIVQYDVDVTCTDNRGSYASGVLTVSIRLNEAPTLDNLDDSISLDPFKVAYGENIFVVTSTDPENDQITYTCEIPNSLTPFECDQSQSNNIVMRRDLDLVMDDGETYHIDVCVGDERHPKVSCGTLSVTFTTSVTYPEISNLPDTVAVSEDTAIGTSIFQLLVNDPDTGDTHTFTMTSVNPSGSLSAFYVDSSSGVVYTNQEYDYESETLFVLTFTVRDQELESSSDTWYLNVGITDVNEPPSITCSNTIINFSEDKDVGTTLDPGCSCKDPDGSDTLTYSISGDHANMFRVFLYTGLLELTTEWDLEASYPLSSTLLIECSDAQETSETEYIHLNIAPVNEFSPTVTYLYPRGTTPEISASTSLLASFLTISAIDNDVYDDGLFFMEIIQPVASSSSSKASEYFYIKYLDDSATSETGGSRGALMLTKTPDFTSNGSMVINVKVSDGETPALVSGTSLTVYYYASGEQTTSEKTELCVTCTSNGRLLIAVVCIEGVIVALFVAHVIWNFKFRRDTVSQLRRNPRRGNSTGNQSRISVISGTQLTRLGPSNSGFRNAGALAASSQAAQNSRPDRNKEISDSESGDSSDSSTASDDSRTFNAFNNAQKEVGRTGFLRTSSGLPTPVYARNAGSSGLPPPLYCSNTPSVSKPNFPSSNKSRAPSNSGSNQSSRVSGQPSQAANPFSSPNSFQHNYA